MKSYRLMTNLEMENSLEYWWPIVKKLGIEAPKTKIVPLTQNQIDSLANEKMPLRVVNKIERAAESFGVPFFLRTDQCSAKHSWNQSCYVSSISNLPRHIFEIIQYHLMADLFGIPFHSFVVREFIPLETIFTAFVGNMPVAKERRYFVKNGELQCHHEYWIEGAVRQGMTRSDIPEREWLPKVITMNTEDEAEIDELTEIAIKVSEAIKGYWSVDFAKTKDGRWLLIDMARGELSYHKPDCQFAGSLDEHERRENL